MHYIGGSKVGKVNPNPRSSYPLIRLPQQYSGFIGKTAHIFKTEHQDQQALFILLESGEPTASNIIQSVYNFIQSETEISVESPLSALESSIEVLDSKIDKLIELNFQNNELSNNKSLKNGGLDRIRTGDLRCVKARIGLNSFEPQGISCQSLCIQSCLSDHELHNLSQEGLGDLQLPFTNDELKSYVKARALGLSDKTIYWIDKAAGTFWNATNGTVSKKHMDMLRQSVLNKYQSEDSKGKMLAFAKAFLTYLTKMKLDTRYHAFEVFLEMPKALKKRKDITSRVITKEDIEIILSYVRKSELDGSICHSRALQYAAFVVFGAYTGQRSLATASKLTVGQFRAALQFQKPVLHVESSQDKIKMDIPFRCIHRLSMLSNH